MRLRDKNNAASTACVFVAFVLVGCLKAVCGVVAEFETYVLKFGFVAYVFIAGPLFLVSLCGPMTPSKQKSFRPTPPGYLDGKRLKPRVRRVATLFSFALLLLFFGSMALFFVVAVFLEFDNQDNPRAVWLGFFFFWGIPIALQAAGRILLTRLFVRLGWLTSAEAPDFAWMTRRYPPSCLEPFEEDE